MKPDSNILISGGSGLLGAQLRSYLQDQGYQISVLSRKNRQVQGAVSYLWNPEKEVIDPLALKNKAVIINFAGAGIADRSWTPKRKLEILDSRKKSLKVLFETLKRTPNEVKTLISASAVGIYGNTGDRWVNEQANPADDFLAETCVQWEQAAREFESLGIRVVILRIGIVLSREGGALVPLARVVKWFLGSTIGSGSQFLSWIHIRDLEGIIFKCMEDERISGIYNAVAPVPVNNKELMKSLSRELHRPLWPIHVPPFILKLILGKRADLIVGGQRVSCKKIQDAGFEFTFPELKFALRQLCSGHESSDHDLLVPA